MLPGLMFTISDRVATIGVDVDTNNIYVGIAGGLLADLDHPIDLHVHVAAGVTLGADQVAAPAASPGPALSIDLPAGSRVFIKNLGRIWGGGGRGGGGDRGKREEPSASAFCGGGGGGGAGSTSSGGPKAVESDPDASHTDGEAAAVGATVGGNPGDNDYGAGIPNGGFTRGVDAQFGGDAIYFGSNNIEIFIDNEFGEIWAGAPGGTGGFQIGDLPMGDNLAVKGGDTPGSVTILNGSLTTEAKAVGYKTGSTLTWVPAGGAAYPNVAGYINKRP